MRTNTSANNSNLVCDLVILMQPAVNYYPKSTLFGTLGTVSPYPVILQTRFRTSAYAIT